MDGTALAIIDALLGRNAISKVPRAAGYRASDFVLCEDARTPAWRTSPRAPTAGVREAPRHEIAGRWGAPIRLRERWGLSTSLGLCWPVLEEALLRLLAEAFPAW